MGMPKGLSDIPLMVQEIGSNLDIWSCISSSVLEYSCGSLHAGLCQLTCCRTGAIAHTAWDKTIVGTLALVLMAMVGRCLSDGSSQSDGIRMDRLISETTMKGLCVHK